jgi:hypothetical protein
MTYFQEIDAWLSTILLGGTEDETDEQWFQRIKKEIKQKILESYRNGQKAGLSPKATGKDKPAEPNREKPPRPLRRYYHGR